MEANMRNMLRASCAAAWVFAYVGLQPEVATAASAQGTSATEFPSQVEVVTVDAVVVDANGRSVPGLTKDDFVVEEDGQPQSIVTFEAVSVPPEPAAAASRSEPSWTVTNAGPEAPAGRAFAILADDLRLPFEQSQHVREAMAHFINESLGPGDTVIVATTSGDTWWKAGIPEGREDLLGILDRVKGRYVDPGTRDHVSEYEAFEIVHREAGSGPHQSVLDALRHPLSVSERVAVRLWDLGLCGRKDEPMQSYEACFPMVRSAAADIDGARNGRTSATLRALEGAISALAPFHGRKSLVFLSPGFLEDDDLTQQDVATAALDARTAVYFVDARGLETGSLGAEASSDHQSLENPGRETQRRLEELTGGSGGAQALAEETGGFTVHNANDLAAAAERIAAESRTFYLIGFEPPAGKAAKAWRKLRVTVRRSGVTTRARRGYRLDAATVAAMGQPAGSSAIPLRLASYVLDPLAGDRTRVVAAIEIDVSSISATGPDETASPLQLRLEATPRGGGEAQVQDVSLQPAHPGAPEGLRAGPVWRSARLELELPVGVHQVRAYVHDPTTGRSGIVEQRVVVPEPTAFRLSTPVLSDQVTRSDGAKGSPSPSPGAHSQFEAGSGRPVVAAFEAFGAAKDSTGQSRVESRVVLQDRAGRPLAAPPASALVPSAEGRLRQVVALPQLPAGDYDLVITAEDRIAGKTEEAHRPFSVQGPTAAAPPTPPPGKPTKVSPELAAILERAGRYVSAYGQDFSDIVAEEECRQVYEPDSPARRKLRNTRAGVFFVTLPGPLPWTTFRDVWEVDGNEVHERAERLGQLFHDSPGTAREGARAILEESARYNLGPVRRTVNIPTLALLFLSPENQGRFSFDLKGKRTIEGTKVVEVAFKERASPTLVQGDTRAGAPAKGRLWIDPDNGAVLKTDVEYDIDPQDEYHRSRARIVTEYRLEPKLGILVPDRMKETYQSLAPEATNRVLPDAHSRTGDAQDQRPILTVEATSRYSAYRRFSVTTNEIFTSAPKKPR
jgi:VWFA-related protein